LKALQTASLEAGADFELWYADGVRFDLLPVSRGMWHVVGKKLYVPTPGKNVRVAVCGAYRYPEGPFLSTFGSKSVTTALFIPLLQLLTRRAKRTRKRIILVLDNGSSFTSKRSRAELAARREFVRPFWIPKYTSETLNRIENLWGHLKDDYFSRMLTKRKDLFTREVVRFLKRLHRRGALRKLFGDSLPT
jgi:transposase